jgi:ABC-type antimicrobial peptide transport system permease subunit
VVLAAVVGVPVGTALGRTLWTAFTDRIHTHSPPVLPALWLALVLPVALVVANVVAAVPGRLASRTRPSVALRDE